MSDLKDLAIKLFGKTIPLPLNKQEDVSSANKSCSGEEAAAREDKCDHDTTTALHENKAQIEQDKQEGSRVCNFFFHFLVSIYI